MIQQDLECAWHGCIQKLEQGVEPPRPLHPPLNSALLLLLEKFNTTLGNKPNISE